MSDYIIDYTGRLHTRWTASGSGKAPLFVAESLVDDLDAAARRLEHLTSDDRWHHPSTPRAVRIAVDDIVDTIARMREG